MESTLQQRWDLDVLFPGGSASPAFAAHLDDLTTQLGALRAAVAQPAIDRNGWCELFTVLQEVNDKQWHASGFVECLTAQDVKDERAKQLSARVRQLGADYAAMLTELDQKLLAVPQSEWEEFLRDEQIAPIAFWVQERRTRAVEKLPPEQEALASALAVDGYHGWSELYDVVVGRMTIPFEHDGQTAQLSVGQAYNKLSDADRQVRSKLWQEWEAAWQGNAELFASALNRLAGYRLGLYRHRGWESVLKEPLALNRMSEATLQAMWDVIAANKAPLVAYLQRKAQLLGLEKLAWYDVDAPLGADTSSMTYDEAAHFISEHFRRFNPEMADFAERAFQERWIEAEDRPGKRPGGFCTPLPMKQQTRIFLTFDGSADTVSTIAHELGHAYHSHVMWDLPALAQEYAMNVAETASTFAELIVGDAAVQQAQEPQQRLARLEAKVQAAVAFFMNIHARFLFETRFYEARKQGVLSVAELNQLMSQAQEEAFVGALSEYHPGFWASKLHFYITDVPFYNFPYTFGYLFSAGIYARAQEEGPGFAAKYVALLRDTASMTVEELAQRHLGVDLTQPEFWQRAVDRVLADVAEFLRLTDNQVG